MLLRQKGCLHDVLGEMFVGKLGMFCRPNLVVLRLNSMYGDAWLGPQARC
jgi:hypothetical protein